MLKYIALMLVLVTIFNSFLTIADARENDQNSNEFGSSDRIISVNDLSREKFNKKYHKEKEKKNFYPDKESLYKQDKHWEQRDAEKKFSNQNDFDEFRKSDKYSKYDKRGNYHNDPSKNKNVNYHDKSGTYEKEKSYKEEKKKQEIVGETLISLHHDIDVNYLAHPNTSPTDAELIDVEKFGKIQKKKTYHKNVNGNNKKGNEDFYNNLKEIDLITIPSSNNSALIARYILHNVDWTALGTFSTNIKIKGGPFVNVISVSDGPTNKGSGVPFFYMTPKDFSSLDLEKDNRCCITVTLAQTDFCKTKNLDPESPLCARLILSGKVKKIKPGSKEEDFAKLALFSRHPEMKTWPEDHDWFFSKLKIKEIILINHFGGASYVSIQDYFNADSA